MWCRLVGGFLILFSIYHRTSFYEYLNIFDDDVSHMLIASPTGYTVKGVNANLSDCSPLVLGEIIGEGWQKTVFRGNDYAMKKARLNGPTYQQCLQNKQERDCTNLLLRTMIDEISWFYRLRQNGGIVKMKSYCIPRDPFADITQLRIVVELGDALTSLSLVQMQWTDRKHIVEMILAVVRSLTEYTLNDLRRQQFVLVNGVPKMSDLDHITEGRQNDYVVFTKFQKEFLPFLTTSDAPSWFIDGMTNILSITALGNLLERGFHELNDETCT